MKRSVLYISYPMLPVSDASCGGAEQMLWSLEREMNARGWRTSVAACDGSSVSGELLATGYAPKHHDAFEERAADHAGKVINFLSGENGFDLVHDKSGHFWQHAAKINRPVLVTLHLPRSFYPESLFRSLASNVFFNCVSSSQACEFRDLPGMVGVVSNGIAVERFPLTPGKQNYLLWLGRICPEKAPHIAIEVAQRARVPLVIAGQVYPFSYHQQYFERKIKPRIENADSPVRYVESPSFEEKVELLRHARALLISTQAHETSSLVAMEAMACGTPVVAFGHGALSEIVDHGVTGYAVRSKEDMLAALDDLDCIWPEACRARVEEHFTSSRMAGQYEAIYEQVCADSEKGVLQQR
ncbi:MAG TPA: glycosyltransferase [Clostridia bacterium]|nr:glycosyltransferase [Clostridia bacterium]